MAKRQIDKSLQEQQDEMQAGFARRMENISNLASGAFDTARGVATGIVKEEIFGIPGLLGDLAEPLQAITTPGIYGMSPELQEATKDFQEEFGASGLAAKAGIELSDEFLDEEGELRPEMAGRLVAPGALYVKGAQLIPALSKGVGKIAADAFNMTPRPAVAGGPSPMTQAPSDAGPSTTVSMTEAPGTPTGGSSKLQEEKELLFVSPDNDEAVRSRGIPPSEIEQDGLLDTGIYSPLLAAIKNVDIPKQGITAKKLLEKLNREPRAGSELQAYGLTGYLRSMGSEIITREQMEDLYMMSSPKIKILTRLEKPGDYQGLMGVANLRGERVRYNSMQRLKNSVDASENSGVIVFSDDQAQINGRYMRSGHGYFDNDLPGNFGHVRFSIQNVKEGDKTIKAMVVEEIQSDDIKAFRDYDARLRAELGRIPSLASAKKLPSQVDEMNVPGVEPEQAEAATELEIARRRNEARELAAQGALGRRPFELEDKLALSLLTQDKDYVQFKKLQQLKILADDADNAFNLPALESIETFLNTGKRRTNASFSARSMYDDQISEQLKFLLLNRIFEAKSTDEAAAMLSSYDDIPGELPTALDELSPNTGTLNESELLELRKNELVEIFEDKFKFAKSMVEAKQSKSESAKGLSRLISKIPGVGKTDIETALSEKTKDEMLFSLVVSIKETEKNKQLGLFMKKYSDDLLEARRKPARKGEEEEFSIDRTVMTDLRSDHDFNVPFDRKRGSATSTPVREKLHSNEVKRIIGEEELRNAAIDAAEVANMKIDALRAASPVFANMGRIIKLGEKRFSFPRGSLTFEETDLTRDLRSGRSFDELQARHLKKELLERIDQAKANAPTPEKLNDLEQKIQNDPRLGPLYARVSTGDMQAKDLFNRPPFKTQNDFIKFVTRVLPSEAKKLGVDKVIFPGAPELMYARGVGGSNPQQVLNFYNAFFDEKKAMELSQKLSSKKRRDELVSNDDAVEFLRLLQPHTNRTFTLEEVTPMKNSDIANVLAGLVTNKNFTGNASRKARGHAQNYGVSLENALEKLEESGFEVTQPGGPLTVVDPSGVEQGLGSFDRGSFHVDIKEGTPGGELAKKIPSLYNKGGAVKSGIGGMARRVM